MATLYKIGENIIKTFGQKVVGGKITRQEAILAGAQASNKLVRDLIWRNKSDGNETIPYYCFREYRLGIVKDTLRNRWYAKLPIRTLESLYNNRGVYHVAPADDIDDLLVPLDSGFNSMFKGLDAFQLEGKLGYTPERDRIYIQGAEFNEDFELFVRLIPDATSLEPHDELPAPPELEYDIIMLALQNLGVTMQLPRDVVDNNLGT
tara:strand:+ start:4643 stop:5260 length:618 start_codon:yes stop_codon:yes gene_type:complete